MARQIMDKGTKTIMMIEVILRATILIFTIFGISRAVTVKQTKEIFGIQKEATYKQLKAFIFLVVADGILSCYCLIQLMSIYFRTPLLNKALGWTIFSCDQVITYLSFSAAMASIEAAYLAMEGENDFQWFKVCTFFGSFCKQTGLVLASSLIGILCMVIVSLISSYNLFRLYNSKARLNL